jgi:hypothetical protein
MLSREQITQAFWTGVYGLALSGAAAAAPPSGHDASTSGRDPAVEHPSERDISAVALDLRLPAGSPATSGGHTDLFAARAGLRAARTDLLTPRADTRGSESFIPMPKPRRVRFAETTFDEEQLPALGSAANAAPVLSRAQQVVQRIRREGVPFARLWENHAALLSLGLNQRGKPGLWLMQKIP